MSQKSTKSLDTAAMDEVIISVNNPKTDGSNIASPSEDLVGYRKVDTTKQKFHVERTDPHGFWRIRTDKGRLPDILQGQYTSSMNAINAIESYTRT